MRGGLAGCYLVFSLLMKRAYWESRLETPHPQPVSWVVKCASVARHNALKSVFLFYCRKNHLCLPCVSGLSIETPASSDSSALQRTLRCVHTGKQCPSDKSVTRYNGKRKDSLMTSEAIIKSCTGHCPCS